MNLRGLLKLRDQVAQLREEWNVRDRETRPYHVVLETDEDLHAWVRDHLGVVIPRHAVCDGHVAPLHAFADAYFARYPRSVWKASRGFGGKSVLLAALSATEAITLGASVSLLGGSGEQSRRVHEYMSGLSSELPEKFWSHPNAPRDLLLNDPTKRETRLRNHGRVIALMASQASVRGPHPQRLRGDEIDEMDPMIWDAAQGQPMESRGIAEQVLGSSTHQHADGTMTRELAMATEQGWPIYEWCFRECLQSNGGWLSDAQVERKRATVPALMWNTEYELQEPSVENRAIDTASVEAMFDLKRGSCDGALRREPYIFEKPLWELDPKWRKGDKEARRRILRKIKADYAAGADWGKLRDKTIVKVFRIDTDPMRVVAYMHLGRMPYPQMFAAYNDLVERYQASAAHDATGLGTVADDYVEEQTEGVSLVGARRSHIFGEYITGIESRQIVAPRIEHAYREHLYCTADDLYGPASAGHPPDSFVAGALAYHTALRPSRIFI